MVRKGKGRNKVQPATDPISVRFGDVEYTVEVVPILSGKLVHVDHARRVVQLDSTMPPDDRAKWLRDAVAFVAAGAQRPCGWAVRKVRTGGITITLADRVVVQGEDFDYYFDNEDGTASVRGGANIDETVANAFYAGRDYGRAESRASDAPPLPATIDVGGEPYRVRIHDAEGPIMNKEQQRTCFVLIDHDERAVVLSRALTLGHALRCLDRVAARERKNTPAAKQEPETVDVLGVTWKVMESPDRLEDGGEHQNDHADHIIWLSPDLLPSRRVYVVRVAAERARREAAALAAGADRLAVAWAAAGAPADWPMPPGLPSDVKFYASHIDGVPPVILGGEHGKRHHYCPHCGKVCKTTAGINKHLESRHGWQSGEWCGLRPPATTTYRIGDDVTVGGKAYRVKRWRGARLLDDDGDNCKCLLSREAGALWIHKAVPDNEVPALVALAVTRYGEGAR